jgi:hypothetical protein
MKKRASSEFFICKLTYLCVFSYENSQDLGGGTKMRPLWRHHFEGSHVAWFFFFVFRFLPSSYLYLCYK